MSDYTPGPWFSLGAGGTDYTVIASNKGEEVVGVSEWIRAEDKDLQLMATAPELLEEAEKLIDLHVKAMNGNVADNVQWDSAVLNLRNAIAKAKGEQG